MRGNKKKKMNNLMNETKNIFTNEIKTFLIKSKNNLVPSMLKSIRLISYKCTK